MASGFLARLKFVRVFRVFRGLKFASILEPAKQANAELTLTNFPHKLAAWQRKSLRKQLTVD